MNQPGYGPLTPRETQVLRLCAQGLIKRQIALELCCSEKTVEKHVQKCYDKLDLRGRGLATLVHFALANGLITLMTFPDYEQRTGRRTEYQPDYSI